MKYLAFAASSALLFAACTASAQEIAGGKFSADARAVTDYRNRGISRSDDRPALQGDLRFDHDSGIYAGAAASTVDLNLDSDANFETIFFGGYHGNLDAINYDASLSYTAYPGADNEDLDYLEFAVGLDYDFNIFQAGLSWNFSPDYINSSGMAFYYGGDVTVPIADNLKAAAHLGFQYIDDEGPYLNSDASDWSAGLVYNYAPYDVDIGLQYVDTDLDSNECAERCGAAGVLSLSKTW